MSTKDFTANVISASKVVPDGNFKDSKASGIWDINEALDLIKGGNWPNVANINPAAFVGALFQTHLYNGTGSAQTITNGIDLSGKGGLVWIKDRDAGFGHNLFDTARGVGKYLNSDGNPAEATDTTRLSAFNSNGFSLGNQGSVNTNNNALVSWTFRKQPKFFDIVTYTGNGTAGRSISHNLGGTVGTLIIKRTDNTSSWIVWHRSTSSSYLFLDGTDAATSGTISNVSSTAFTIESVINTSYNASGGTYVAYLFAHNNDDGGFGEPGDQDIIKCGSYTGNGSSSGNFVDLGFEPQFIIIKNSSNSANWVMFDSMRGVVTSSSAADDKYLFPNSDTSEGGGIPIDFNATGFTVFDTSARTNTSSDTYVYMAIRRGGMQTPTAASSVFAINEGDSSGAPEYTSGFPVDMAIKRNISDTDNWRISARLIQGINHFTNTNSADDADDKFKFDFQNGYYNDSQGANNFAWMWRRARGYFDVVVYNGNNNYYSSQNVNHNLGVVPEMIWIKNRDRAVSWAVYNKTIGAQKKLDLNGTSGASNNDSAYFNNTTPTSSVFTVGNSNRVNQANEKHIAYLFATVAGVSKVGSYSGTGSSQNIDCGFTAGSSFVLVKRYDGTDSWYIADSARGISSGQTDKIIKLNSTDAEFTESDNSADYIAPHASGFNVPASSPFNGNGDDFIFYAIAAIS